MSKEKLKNSTERLLEVVNSLEKKLEGKPYTQSDISKASLSTNDKDLLNKIKLLEEKAEKAKSKIKQIMNQIEG